MVDFVVFNEKSLPFSDVYKAKDGFIIFFKLLEELSTRNIAKVRMKKEFKVYPVTADLTLQRFFGQLRRGSVLEDRLRLFITNNILKLDSPLIKESEHKEQELSSVSEYYYKEESTNGGLACCDIWDTIAISFDSSEEWDTNCIKLTKNQIEEDTGITNKKINIRHSAKTEHLDSHKDYFEELEFQNRLEVTSTNFWEKRKKLFPRKICFSKEVEKQIKSLDSIILKKAVNILRDIETAKTSLNDYNVSPESQSVRSNPKLKDMRYFTINGKKEFFDKHIKNFSSGYRMHFLEKDDKIYVGYIGVHLSTKNY